MKHVPAMVTVAILGTVASVAGGDPGAGKFAGRAEVATPDYTVEAVVVLESTPPRFELVLARDMPSAGWAVRVEEVGVDADGGHIDIRVTEVPPPGMAATVITRVRSSVELPEPLPAGRYVVTVQARRGESGKFRLVLAAVLSAVP